jgi:transposase
MLNEITVRQIQRHLQKGNSIQYICTDCGVSRSVVYSLINEGFDNHIERIKRKQREPRPRTPRRSYKEALPPEQWDGARMLLTILKRLKGMNVEKPHIDLETLRVVWQKKMAERCC